MARISTTSGSITTKSPFWKEHANLAARTGFDLRHAPGKRDHGEERIGLLDPDVDPDGWGEGAAHEMAAVLPAVDYFLPNEHEAAGLTQCPDPTEAAERLQRLSGGWIVLKLGRRGCLAVGPEAERFEVTAPEVEARDTTGAGDAFDAAFVYRLAVGYRKSIMHHAAS